MELTNTLTNSFSTLAVGIGKAIVGGVIVGLVAALLVRSVLKAFSRHLIHIPPKAIAKISEIVFLLIGFYVMWVLYTKVIAPGML